ncbi:hypothetical protein KP509_35G026200 [Ceratopteris richardii]|uniref:Uncharacterized protein n=1 Tax=Ceratopteris richardii TaxID=49495 RepID=A0A8T2QFJ5_CERRI|nr:hypothetical protein KP509_35G026200 [Ceratopteris richardii]
MADEEDAKVRELLEQFNDEAVLRLSAPARSCLDSSLLERFERLKSGGRSHTEKEGGQSHAEKGGQSHSRKEGGQSHTRKEEVTFRDPNLASRLDVLKASLNPSSQAVPVSPERNSDASEIEKLLQSMRDQISLEKVSLPQRCRDDTRSLHSSSDEEISDSEVDKVLEWAKDAAVLDPDEEEEELEDPVPTETSSTVPETDDPKHKKRANRWKFW